MDPQVTLARYGETPPPPKPIGRTGRRHSPHTIEYWAERFPGFPEYVHEAFAAKTRGEECYQEFVTSIEKPGILTTVQKELEPGVIVDERRVVNWF